MARFDNGERLQPQIQGPALPVPETWRGVFRTASIEGERAEAPVGGWLRGREALPLQGCRSMDPAPSTGDLTEAVPEFAPRPVRLCRSRPRSPEVRGPVNGSPAGSDWWQSPGGQRHACDSVRFHFGIREPGRSRMPANGALSSQERQLSKLGLYTGGSWTVLLGCMLIDEVCALADRVRSAGFECETHRTRPLP